MRTATTVIFATATLTVVVASIDTWSRPLGVELSLEESVSVSGAGEGNGHYTTSGACESNNLVGGQVTELQCIGDAQNANPSKPCVRCSGDSYWELDASVAGKSFKASDAWDNCTGNKLIGLCVLDAQTHQPFCSNLQPVNDPETGKAKKCAGAHKPKVFEQTVGGT